MAADDKLYFVTQELLDQIGEILRWQRTFSLTGEGVAANNSPAGYSARIPRPRPPPAPRLPPPPVVRMKVTDATPGGGATAGVVKAKRWDGTTLTGDEVYVLGAQGHNDSDEVLAVQPQGGVPGSPTDGTNDVIWVEVLLLPIDTDLYQVLQVTSTDGLIGWDWVRAHA